MDRDVRSRFRGGRDAAVVGEGVGPTASSRVWRASSSLRCVGVSCQSTLSGNSVEVRQTLRDLSEGLVPVGVGVAIVEAVCSVAVDIPRESWCKAESNEHSSW